jgi:hypothetical protein
MKKDGIIKPVYKDDPNGVIYPGQKVAINRYFKPDYTMVANTLNHTNDFL